MAISINSLRKKSDPKPPILVLFGTRGVGKSTLAAGAPSPVFCCIEEGLGKLDVPNWKITSLPELMEAIAALYTEEHNFKTLVVDSLDWLESLVWAEVCRRHGWSDIELVGFGKGYVAADAVWREYLDGVTALRDEKGMAIIQIAHENIERFDSPETDPYSRYRMKLHKRASALIQEHAEIVAFLNFRVSIKSTEVGFNRKVTRGVGAAQRVLYLEERPAFEAKNRHGLPPSIELPTTPEAWKAPGSIWAAFDRHLNPQPEPAT